MPVESSAGGITGMFDCMTMNNNLGEARCERSKGRAGVTPRIGPEAFCPAGHDVVLEFRFHHERHPASHGGYSFGANAAWPTSLRPSISDRRRMQCATM
jgi:hypothetical protein